MARPSSARDLMEAERMAIVHGEQKTLSRKLQKEVIQKAGKGELFLPGDESFKKTLAIYLKLGVPRISYTEIANRIGEPKTKVRGWFKDDPSVREKYEWCLANLTASALSYLRTYQLEAITTLATLMRFGSEKYMYEAANAILDRTGLARMTKQESSTEKRTVHTWDESLAEVMRSLPEDKQERFADLMQGIEELTAEAAAKDAGVTEIEADESDFTEVDEGLNDNS